MRLKRSIFAHRAVRTVALIFEFDEDFDVQVSVPLSSSSPSGSFTGKKVPLTLSLTAHMMYRHLNRDIANCCMADHFLTDSIESSSVSSHQLSFLN